MAIIERPRSCPERGKVPPFDAGWDAHEIGLRRDTVRTFAADPAWAILGWDARQRVVDMAADASPDPGLTDGSRLGVHDGE